MESYIAPPYNRFPKLSESILLLYVVTKQSKVLYATDTAVAIIAISYNNSDRLVRTPVKG